MASRARRPDLRDVRPPSPRSLHDAGHALHVAVAVVRIDEDGQARCVGDVAHRGAVRRTARDRCRGKRSGRPRGRSHRSRTRGTGGRVNRHATLPGRRCCNGRATTVTCSTARCWSSGRGGDATSSVRRRWRLPTDRWACRHVDSCGDTPGTPGAAGLCERRQRYAGGEATHRQRRRSSAGPAHHLGPQRSQFMLALSSASAASAARCFCRARLRYLAYAC
jgi:hypothetical protein